MKKYELTKESTIVNGVKLFRIKKLSNGELGGFVEKEKNLSQLGNAWVFGDARVYGKLKLLAGYFFGKRYRKEEIRYVQVDDDYELIYKGEAMFGKEELKSLSGKTVKVEVDGETYEATIK